MSDGLDVYNQFDSWTERTGILNGGGLTWVVRLPLNLIVVVISIIVWVLTRQKKEARNG